MVERTGLQNDDEHEPQEQVMQEIFTNSTVNKIDEEFFVRNPQDNGGHMTYEVSGRDQ